MAKKDLSISGTLNINGMGFKLQLMSDKDKNNADKPQGLTEKPKTILGNKYYNAF